METPLKPLIWALQDSVMVLAPRGWQRVELAFTQTPAGRRLTDLTTAGAGAKAPDRRLPLPVDPQAEALRLSLSFDDLLERLQRPQAVRAVVERTEDFSDWRLLDAAGQLAYFTRVPRAELDQLLMTDALFDLIDGSAAGFHYLQAQLEGRVAAHPGGAAGLLAHAPHELIGDYFPKDFVFLWAWADDGAQSAHGALRRICAPDSQPAGLGALWRPALHVEEGTAWTVAAAVSMSLGARGLLRVPHAQGDGVSFVALEPSLPA